MAAEDDSINQVLARNLAFWMSEAGLTQTALAKRAEVDQKTISNYLNPKQRVAGSKGKEPSAKLTELSKIARALAIDVWQLLRDQTESERKMYAAIEANFATLKAQMQEAANAPRPQDVEAFEESRVTKPRKPERKKKAA